MNKTISESLNNILQIIEAKCTDAEGVIHVDPAHLEPFAAETDYLLERMGLSPFQSVLFAVVVQSCASGRCSLNTVGKHLGMSYLQLLSRSQDLYALRDKWLIQLKGSLEIKVPQEVIESLMKDKPFEKPKIDGLTTRAMFYRITSLMRVAYKDDMQPTQLLEEIDAIINANPQTSFSMACAKHIKTKSLSDGERLLFYVCAFMYFKRGVTVFEMNDIEDYIIDENWMFALKNLADVGALELQVAGVFVPANADGLMSRGSFSFKEEVVRELFADANVKISNLKTIDLSDCSGKPAKQLFYNMKEKGQVERLGALLDDGALKSVFDAMQAKGLRTGFSCLFYGDPGTGKTETVYQLARQTGRKILEADVAKIRNCYVGETEKNMRALFADYRIACKENERTPILLFNEADAILGTRLEGAVRSVDRMENSVQNILLQEMENFSGIMIATTNLKGNLDPAFERRFLYKIRFNKPEPEPRAQIWRSQFPFLSEDDAHKLASDFDLSGGQIENIVRKQNIDSILSGAEPSYDTLCAYCREESSVKSQINRIGF